MKEQFPGSDQICSCDSLDVLVKLAKTCGLDESPNNPAEDLGRILATPYGRAFAAFDGDNPIGMAVVSYDGRRGWISYVGVIPEARRHGVALKLVDTALVYLEELGAPRASLLIRENSKDLIGFYNKIGFLQQPVTVMSKDLLKRNFDAQ